jgi:hypothetical protein
MFLDKDQADFSSARLGVETKLAETSARAKRIDLRISKDPVDE